MKLNPAELEQTQRRVAIWKEAGPVLQAIRDEELRQTSNKGIRPVRGIIVYERCPHRNGLVIMQAWFMRAQLLKSTASKNTSS